MEEHDDASLMLGEEEHHHHHHPAQHHPHHHHHHDDDDHDDNDNDHEHDEHEMHEDEEHMDIEPTRIEGVSTATSASPAPLRREDFWEHEPSKEEIWEMGKANKLPSEWLKLLCKDWAEAAENIELIATVDSKFQSYKPYLKGKLSSQLLCRLCIPSESGSSKETTAAAGNPGNSSKADFLRKVFNIQDEFDKAYVTAQVERFCTLYDIRGLRQQAAVAGGATGTAGGTATANQRFAIPNNEATAAAAAALYGDLVVNAALGGVSDVHQQAIAASAAAAAATATVASQQQAPTQSGITIPPHFLTPDATAAAVAAAQQAQAAQQSQVAAANPASPQPATEKAPRTSDEAASGASNASVHQVFANSRAAQALLSKAQQQAKSAERALEQERKANAKREQKRISQNKKLARQRDREFVQKQKQAEKLAREKARDEKRIRKLMQRQQRENFAQQQKEAALRRAADLVASNRVPIEITRAGAFRNRLKTPLGQLPETSSKKAASRAKAVVLAAAVPKKRQRSAIVVSTASDLNRIVTHSQNLWAKYNAIAREHNQRVNWITVAKELGIHVKVREKYARMHSRALQRNFDFVAHGHWKIKDHPEIFQEPTAAEQKARMPPPLPIEMVADPRVFTGAGGAEAEKSGDAGDEPPHTGVVVEGAEGRMDRREDERPSHDEQVPVKTEATPMAAAPAAQTPAIEADVPGANDPVRDPMAAGSEPAAADHHHHLNSADAAAAAATAAAVVDAAGVGGATIDIHHVVELTAAATSTTMADGTGRTTEEAAAAAAAAEVPHEATAGDTAGGCCSDDLALL